MGIPLDRFSTFILEEATLDDAVSFLKELGVDEDRIVIFEQLKIDDVRWIKEQAELAREKVGFAVGDLTYDAQNAMLKLAEEPPEFSYFVFYKTENLLDTICSRAQIIRIKHKPSVDKRLIDYIEQKNWPGVLEILFSLNGKTDILNLIVFLIHYYAERGKPNKALKLGEFYKRFKEFNLNEKLLLVNTFGVIEEQE